MLTKVDRARILEMHAAGVGATEIAREVGISRSTANRVIKREAGNTKTSRETVGGDDGRPSGASESELGEVMRRAHICAMLEAMLEVATDEERFAASVEHRAYAAVLEAALEHAPSAPLPELERAAEELGARFRALALGVNPVAASKIWDGQVEAMREFEGTTGLQLRSLQAVFEEDPTRIGEVLAALVEVDELEADVTRLRARRETFAKEVRALQAEASRLRGELQMMDAQRWALWQELGWLQSVPAPQAPSGVAPRW